MKGIGIRWIVACLLIFGTVMSNAQALQSVVLNDRVTIHRTVLDNGLTVFLVPNTDAPLVSMYHWVKAGSLHEKKGITGMAHLFEHMMFRPIRDGDVNFHEKLRPYGGSVNANTRFESTVYETHVPELYLKEAIQHEADRFINMKVTDTLLDIEREAVRSEYSTKFDSSPVIDLWFKIYNVGFPNHPFEWMIVGYKQDLDSITADDCTRFFDRLYRPNNVGLVVAGNIDVNQTLDWIQTAYADWEPSNETGLPAPYSGPAGYVHAYGKLESRTQMVLAGYRIPYIDDQNVVQLEVLNHILFDSAHNLAKLRLLDDKKMVSAVDGFNFHYDSGMMKFMVNILPGYTIDQLKAELVALRKDVVDMSPDRFLAYLNEYYIDTAEHILSNQDLAMAIIYSWGKYNNVSFLGEVVRGELSFSQDDLLIVFDQFIREDNLVIVESPLLKK